MPECHKCRWNGKAASICLRCADPPENPTEKALHIRSFEYLPESVLAKLYAPESESEPEYPARLTEFMRDWIRLPAMARELIALALTDSSLNFSRMARKLGVSRQAVHQCLRKTRVRYPVFRSILKLRYGKIRKRKQ